MFAVKYEDKTALIAKVSQAGVFTIKEYPQENLDHLLGSYCPSLLYPYAREALSSMAVRGGFPQLHLVPINFEALYAQKLAKLKADAEAGHRV